MSLPQFLQNSWSIIGLSELGETLDQAKITAQTDLGFMNFIQAQHPSKGSFEVATTLAGSAIRFL